MPKGDNSIDTRFKIGDKAAEKWTEDSVYELMLKMRNNSVESKEILCVQDAIHSVGLYSSGLDYLLKKFPNFENIKEDVKSIIIARINNRALQNQFSATASIWRFKQLGERDNKEIDIKDDRRTLDNEAREARIKELKEKLGLKDE